MGRNTRQRQRQSHRLWPSTACHARLQSHHVLDETGRHRFYSCQWYRTKNQGAWIWELVILCSIFAVQGVVTVPPSDAWWFAALHRVCTRKQRGTGAGRVRQAEGRGAAAGVPARAVQAALNMACRLTSDCFTTFHYTLHIRAGQISATSHHSGRDAAAATAARMRARAALCSTRRATTPGNADLSRSPWQFQWSRELRSSRQLSHAVYCAFTYSLEEAS